MYRVTVTLSEDPDGQRVYALFERVAEGKTQRLENKGLSLLPTDAVRIESHWQACRILQQYVPILLSELSARLDDSPLF